jgi:transposase
MAFLGLVRNEPGKAGMFSVELYGRVRHACHVEGLSQREAARRFGIHRSTVRKMLAFSVLP